MSYKKWVYKYKYLKYELNETEELKDKYQKDFNSKFTFKDKKDPEVVIPKEDELKPNPKKEKNKEIKDLYKKLSKKLHPDKGGNEEDFKEISELYSEENILGMYLKAEELGVELEESDLENIEETFDKSCSIISEKNLLKHQTLAWVWATCPLENKEALIEKIKKTYNLEYQK